jgi:hypothetical protein
VQRDHLRGRSPLTDVEQLRHETLLSIDDDLCLPLIPSTS